MKQRMRDKEMWIWWGNYGMSAITVAMDHCFSGEEAKSKYTDKPIMSSSLEKSEEKNDYAEKQEEVAVFEMKQRIELLRKRGLPESPM